METQASRDCRSGFRLWLVVASGVMVASGLLYYAFRSSAPCYQGKTSAEWFREFQRAATRHWTVWFVTPSAMDRAFDSRALLREPAARGLRALGTNAAVYLGHQYAQEDGMLARTYSEFYYFRLPARLEGRVPKPAEDRNHLRMEIGWALEALGTNASAAAPSLITALRSHDGFTIRITLDTLRGLEFDRHELDPLLEKWSQGGHHKIVVLAVAELQAQTAVAARCLARALSSGDTAVRRSSV